MTKRPRLSRLACRIFTSQSVPYEAELLEPRVLLAAHLVRDLNASTLPSNPRDLVELNGILFFVADDGVHGRELWRSDGTKRGTIMVRDINPTGDGMMSTDFYSPSLTAMDGTLFFVASDGRNGQELWRSDGTKKGTVLVRDVNPGGGDSIDKFLRGSGRTFTARDGSLFYAANDGRYGTELWRSDGTKKGTVMVADIRPGLSSPDGPPIGSEPAYMNVVNDRLVFRANSDLGYPLWTSDGTKTGTVALPTGDIIDAPIKAQDVLFFEDPFQDPSGLWKTDGTAAGTTYVSSERFLPNGPEPTVAGSGRRLFFSASREVEENQELWTSDGTPEGTVLIKEFDDGSFPGSLTDVDGTMFFLTYDATLWKSDGTDAGTVIVHDFETQEGESDGYSFPQNLTNVDGTLYFAAWDSGTGSELWKSDGTGEGTVRIRDINLGFLSASPGSFTSVGDTVYFTADDGHTGRELWKSDGTTAGTVRIRDINLCRNRSSNPSDLTSAGGELYFVADDAQHGRELWKSNGTRRGTTLVTDIWPSLNSGTGVPVSSDPANLFLVNGTLFFSASVQGLGRELWRTTSGVGATLVKDIAAGGRFAGNNSDPHGLAHADGVLYFAASDIGVWAGDEDSTGFSNFELWRSDGTESGTVRVKEIHRGFDSEGLPRGANPTSLVGLGRVVFFSAHDGSHGRELWRSDGTEQGTMLVKDISPGDSSAPAELTVVDGVLYFTAQTGRHGRELWRSDGTEEGTALVKDISPDGSSEPASLTVVNGTLYFTAKTGRDGRELWRSDGTAAGTVRVADIAPGGRGSNPATLTSVGGVLFFSADDGTHGRELWHSDGTAPGTHRVADIAAGGPGSDPAELVDFGGTLFFSADDRRSGRELWRSDGRKPEPRRSWISAAAPPAPTQLN